MSEDPLYELARQRIDRRNRRWLLLGADFFLFLLYIGVFTAFSGIPRNVGAFLALTWLGVLVMHVFILNVTQNRDEAIDNEIAKLRVALMEKPKRLDVSDGIELSDDGGLIGFDDMSDGDLTDLDDFPQQMRRS